MFFNNKKNEALDEHEKAIETLYSVYSDVILSSKNLNNYREKACKLIDRIEKYINVMTRTPKTIDRKLGEIRIELAELRKTEEYAQIAYEEAVKSGVFSAAGASVGITLVAMSSSEWKDLTKTFGRKNTDAVIETLSSNAKIHKKTKTTLIDSFKDIIHTRLGKIGIGVTAGSLAVGIAYVSYTNYNTSNQIVENIVKIDTETNHLRKKNAEIKSLTNKIKKLITDLKKELYKLKILSEKYKDYISLSKQSKSFLIVYINNTRSLAELLNKEIK